MIVSSQILRALCSVGLCVVGAAAGAAAESCDPASIIEAYRQGEASYQAQDFAAAAARFRPLAEQGLGPAQLRLGEIVQTGDKPDLTAAYHWIALAADVHAPGAAAALIKVRARIGPAQIAMDGFTTTLWRPDPVWPCLAADPRVTRPDGTAGYDFARVINHDPVATPTTAPAHRDWLAMSLETIRTRFPRSLIYLKALNGMGFINVASGPFVIPGPRDNLPFVWVNESYTGKISAKDPGQLLTAVATAVHAALVPQAFVSTASIKPVTETYKGYTIRTNDTANGQGFLKFAKAAVDITDHLPPDLLKLARTMTDIRFEPHRPGDGRAGAAAFGTFMRDPKTGQGYMSFADNERGRGAAYMAVALVGGGVYLRRAGTGQIKGGADAQHVDCEMDAIELKSMQALGLDTTDMIRARTRRGC